MASHNDHLPRYPEREGIYRGEFNCIVGRNPVIYPKLFITSGNAVFTWKDGINEDERYN